MHVRLHTAHTHRHTQTHMCMHRHKCLCSLILALSLSLSLFPYLAPSLSHYLPAYSTVSGQGFPGSVVVFKHHLEEGWIPAEIPDIP